MSAEAVAWVYRHSQATGSAFAVHLAIGDSVNDQHGFRFWMSRDILAAKARVARDTVTSAIRRLVELGYLALERPANGCAAIYRFLFPEPATVAFDTRRDSSTGGWRDSSTTRRDSATPQNKEVVLTQEELNAPQGGPLAPKGSGPPPPEPSIPHELTSFYVDISREHGGDPTRRQVGQVAKTIRELHDVGKPRRVLRRAVGVLAEKGKPAAALEWFVAEVEREIAKEEALRAQQPLRRQHR